MDTRSKVRFIAFAMVIGMSSLLQAEHGYGGGSHGYGGGSHGYGGEHPSSYYERDGRDYNYYQGDEGVNYSSPGIYPYVDDAFGNPNYDDDPDQNDADAIFDSYDQRNR